MDDINLKLTLDEVNLIIKALAQEPFKDVYELIGKINEQADQEIKTQNKENKEK